MPLFVLLAAGAAWWAPTREIGVVLVLLLATVYLFVFEVVEIDVAGIIVMVLIGLISAASAAFGFMTPLVPAERLFDGFASNAVVSIIAVMIIGAGLDRTGIMNRVAAFIMHRAGHAEARIVPAVSGTTGLISGFMQNVGAVALFLPVVARISARTGLPMTRILMPMGFSAILGGTLTMVGSSPLILLNDLLAASPLPDGQAIPPWSMFSVTPIGLVLVGVGIAYFALAGRRVLPKERQGLGGAARAQRTAHYFQELYGLEGEIVELSVPADSSLAGRALGEVERAYRVRVVAAGRAGETTVLDSGGLDYEMPLEGGDVLGVFASPGALAAFVEDNRLTVRPQLDVLAEVLAPMRAGVAEVVVSPASGLIGKSARDVRLRKSYGCALLAVQRGGKSLLKGEHIRDLPLQSGDTLVVHTPWKALARLEGDRDFLVVTSGYPHEDIRPHKERPALLFFGLAVCLLVFTDVRLSLALMAGAIGMVVSGVLRIDEAYRAVSWKTVFLLASLIPLGMAVENSGTAAWISAQVLGLLGAQADWVFLLALMVMATLFTLVMSNIGATVLLVPLAVNIALGIGANPAVFALAVALSTSNAFILPTHQVSALIMGPGGYRVVDFMRAGSVMSVLFLVTVLAMLVLFYGV